MKITKNREKKILLVSLLTITGILFLVSLGRADCTLTNIVQDNYSITQNNNKLKSFTIDLPDIVTIKTRCYQANYSISIPSESDQGAKLFINPDNYYVTYTLKEDFSGNDTFDFTVTAEEKTKTSTMNIKITESDTTETAPEILEVHPADLTTNKDADPVAPTTSFAVLLSDKDGIETGADNVTFTISYEDEDEVTYERRLSDMVVVNAEKKKGSATTSAKNTILEKFWVMYDKSSDKETDAKGSEYPYGTTVSIKVSAKNINNESTEDTYTFEVISKEDLTEDKITPKMKPDTENGTTTYEFLNDNETLTGEIEVAEEEAELTFVKADKSKIKEDLEEGMSLVGEPIYVLTSLVLEKPATIRFYPGIDNLDDLSLYYTNGAKWGLARGPGADGEIDASALDLIADDSWKINKTADPAYIEVQVYHFSGFCLATSISSDSESHSDTGGGDSSEEKKGMCFINTIIR
ncbi:MAG: hypothetical protein V1872_06030 [bacterium]